eukprot:TRINITY_DN332_c0_g1_i2.p1 TRINITY_DN332_c0_g1~~TRINITY_DN332_c0_g1_i2.p1  ORF type:complete len:505 (-),score=147.90 TRINITY_DN332_c0_g1_i2:205-1719(-)
MRWIILGQLVVLVVAILSLIHPFSVFIFPQKERENRAFSELYSLKDAKYPDLEVYTADSGALSLDVIREHSVDHSHHDASFPAAVVYPKSTEHVSAVMKVLSHWRVPVTVCGARTGLEGGSIPTRRGAVLDVSKMKKVFEIMETDQIAHIEAGIKKSELAEYLKPRGWVFPVDPGSDASLGGYASTGASGTLTIKYGTMKENVVSLVVVLPNGEIMRTASLSRKSSMGYDLTHLFLGSEGTLGVITELFIRIRRPPPAVVAAVATFETLEQAVDTVSGFLQSGTLGGLARCEVLNARGMEAVNLYFMTEHPLLPTLFLEFHGRDQNDVEQQAILAKEIASKNGMVEMRFTSDEEERDLLWKARRDAYFASIHLRLGDGMKLLVTDVCVPMSKLASLIMETEKDFRTADPRLDSPIIGHVADGNFHVFVPFNTTDPHEVRVVSDLNERMVHRALEAGGTSSGEHGVGVGKKHSLIMEFDPAARMAMKALKKAIDPDGLMNPDKIV